MTRLFFVLFVLAASAGFTLGLHQVSVPQGTTMGTVGTVDRPAVVHPCGSTLERIDYNDPTVRATTTVPAGEAADVARSCDNALRFWALGTFMALLAAMVFLTVAAISFVLWTLGAILRFLGFGRRPPPRGRRFEPAYR